jgi:large subunit ribosomal protein L30
VSRLLITQTRSVIGTTRSHRGTLRSLGLGRIGRSRAHEDSPSLQAQIRKVANLVHVEEARDG